MVPDEVGALRASVGDAMPGDAGDFAEWIAAHVAVLAALAVREVGAADAEDVVQEALLRAWRRRSTYDPARGSARAWLVGVLLDQARRHRVRRRPRLPSCLHKIACVRRTRVQRRGQREDRNGKIATARSQRQAAQAAGVPVHVQVNSDMRSWSTGVVQRALIKYRSACLAPCPWRVDQ